MTVIVFVFKTLQARVASFSILEEATVLPGIVPAYCAH
jgi:hypothetical protein